MRAAEIRAYDTRTPIARAAANKRRFLLNANASASEKNPAAPSPDENEQLVVHSLLMTNGGVNSFEPPNP